MKFVHGKKIVAIAIVLILLVVAILFATGTARVGGYKVSVTGKVTFDVINKWDVRYDSQHVEQDSFVGLWYMPWETKDVNLIVELVDDESGQTYVEGAWVGKLGNIVDSKTFTVYFRHIPSGNYHGTIYLYEVEKSLIPGFEKDRDLIVTGGFTVVIEE